MTHLLNRIKQNRNRNESPRQIIRLRPHGRDQRDSQARRLGRAAEAHGNGLLFGHLLYGYYAFDSLGQTRLGDVRVDGSREERGRTGQVEADEGEDDVEPDVDEDVEDDVRFG